MMNPVNSADNQNGLTLVELLVAMAVFGLLMAGLIRILDTSNAAYALQQQIAEMQQNVRVAKIFLERDIRMAGCGLQNFYHEGEQVFGLEFENNSGENSSDRLTINFIDYSETGCDDVLEELTLSGTMPVNSAEAEVNEELGDYPYSKWDTGFECNGVAYAGQGGGGFNAFKAIITAPDRSRSDVVYITNVQNTGGTDKVQNRPYGGFHNKVLNSYPAGSTINFFDETKLKQVVYRISDNVLQRSLTDAGDSGTNFQPIAENIEDLQFAFGLDTDDDGEIDTWINNADLTDTQKEEVRAVRINILGRTRGMRRSATGIRPAIEDHAAGSMDRYVRYLSRVTVKVRNIGL